jgi:hypothetical protein
VTKLAERLGARHLDASIAYLTSEELRPTPFARAYRLEEALPFHRKRLAGRLRALCVGRVTVTKRGSAVDAADLVRRLKLAGPEGLTLILTRVQGKPYALIARPAAGAGAGVAGGP